MTQQYIAGEFSSLLADLQPAPGEWLVAVDDLRREVECSPVRMLPPLAHEAMNLTEVVFRISREPSSAASSGAA
jgi:hypothetical protein